MTASSASDAPFLLTYLLLSSLWFFVLPSLVQPLWDTAVRRLCGGTLAGFLAYGLSATHLSMLLLGNSFFACLYLLRPSWSESRRSSPLQAWPWLRGAAARSEFVSLVALAIGLTALNNSIAFLLGFANAPVFQARGLRLWAAEGWPSGLELLAQTLLCVVAEDACFYVCHRTLHSSPLLYRTVHKLHHRWVTSISIAAEATHPLEFILGNALPVLAGPLLLGRSCHAFTLAQWVALRVWETVDGHSGIDLGIHPFRRLPWASTTEGHELHHKRLSCNYGSTLLLWDGLCATAIAGDGEEGAKKRAL